LFKEVIKSWLAGIFDLLIHFFDALLPGTNLNIHRTSLNKVTTVAATTFGAPSAHSLGFAHGGLRQTWRKLDEVVRACSAPGTSGKDPLTRLNQLELRFHARARECLVMSQALGAAVTAAAEVLVTCITEKRLDTLRQMYNIGLLLHSVCLLSTAGKEAAMIDDFAGAYAGLKLSLCLAPVDDDSLRGSSVEQQRVTLDVAEITSNEPASQTTAFEFAGSPGGEGGGGRGCAMGAVKVVLRISPRLAHDWIVSTLGKPVPEVHVVPVLFNLGKHACALLYLLRCLCFQLFIHFCLSRFAVPKA